MKGGHISVAVPMLNESESVDALSGILAHPITTPCSFDPSAARCILFISGEEVSWH